jgi:hypothetical protein
MLQKVTWRVNMEGAARRCRAAKNRYGRQLTDPVKKRRRRWRRPCRSLRRFHDDLKDVILAGIGGRPWWLGTGGRRGGTAAIFNGVSCRPGRRSTDQHGVNSELPSFAVGTAIFFAVWHGYHGSWQQSVGRWASGRVPRGPTMIGNMCDSQKKDRLGRSIW